MENARKKAPDPGEVPFGGSPEAEPAFSGQAQEQMRKAVNENLSRQILSMMQACVHCGLCAEACHYYCSTGEPEVIPARKSEKLYGILRKHFDPVGSRFRLLKRSGRSDLEKLTAPLYKAAFEDCTLCGRCALNCPMGINAAKILYLARAMLCQIGRLPSGLNDPIQVAFETGNYIGLSTEDFVENMEWIGEEMQEEMEDPGFSIPVDKAGAEILYVPHPLEVRDFPFVLMASVKLMHAAGEDYTFSSHHFDVTNYAYYQGSRENTLRILQRMLGAAERLQAQTIVLSPCGHGFLVMRREAPKLLGKRLPVPVLTMVELIDRYVRTERIRLEKDKIEGPVTFHDPCNIGRIGGVLQEPRNILRAITSDFVEMEPHGAWSYCCGGGGGLSATGDYGKRRVAIGKTKAEQIRRTGAKVVATGCYNCMTQIRELNKAYDLGVEVKSIVELAADSLKGKEHAEGAGEKE